MKRLHFSRAAAGILCLGLVLQGAQLLPAQAAAAGVCLNEVCPKSTAAPGYDWIELYNPAASALDLSGWGLSDKASKPFAYTFPSGTTIAAGGFLTVFCDSTAAASDPAIAAFGLSTSGETVILTRADGTTADTLTFTSVPADTAYGRYPDGSDDCFNLVCTPGKANSAPEGSAAVALPVFSLASGFYDEGTKVTIDAPAGTTVYYTSGYTTPDPAVSPAYAGAITLRDRSGEKDVLAAYKDISTSGYTPPASPVTKANVITAVAVDADGNVSRPVTKTYFVGKSAQGYFRNMKVVSLVTDEANLFDYDTGIYCLGVHYDTDNENSNPGGWGWFGGFGGVQPWEMSANYTQKGREWERPASIAVFDKGELVLEENAGIRIKGAASRHTPQKSFNVYARLDYGAPEFAYDFFDGTAIKAKNGKSLKSFETISLRNGGNDNGYAYFRDSINQQLTADRAFAHQATSECMLFLDGEFWGIYQITEKLSDTFLKDHYGVAKSDVALVKSGELEEGVQADLDDWNTLTKNVADGIISYQNLADVMDVQSFIDYFAAQIYWANADWPQNNYAAWRTDTVDAANPYADGRWRMVVFDTESGQGLYGSEDKGVNADGFTRIARNTDDLSRMFTKLMQDADFRADFARTMMDLGNYNFTPERTKAVISGFQETYMEQMTDTLSRWYPKKGRQDLETEYQTITSFYAQRFSPAERTLRQAAGLTGEPKTLTLQNDAASGAIRLNTLSLGAVDSFTGKYHTDYALTLTALPKEGCTFSHWELSGAKLTAGAATDAEIAVKLTGDATVQAVYNALTPGDYNADGSVDAKDVVLLQQYLLGKPVTIAAADVVADGSTDVFDLAMLKRMVR